jgi:hypothetical protein
LFVIPFFRFTNSVVRKTVWLQGSLSFVPLVGGPRVFSEYMEKKVVETNLAMLLGAGYTFLHFVKDVARFYKEEQLVLNPKWIEEPPPLSEKCLQAHYTRNLPSGQHRVNSK